MLPSPFVNVLFQMSFKFNLYQVIIKPENIYLFYINKKAKLEC